jgi:hypothetical protein
MDSVSAVKCAIACAHISRFGWHGRRASQAGGEAPGQSDARSTSASRTGSAGLVNYMLVMRDEREDLVAIGPVSIEYQAAMTGDELEESAGGTTVGIARVLTEEQARTIAAATGG